MREIEFRAKDNHGKWRHGSYVKFEGLQGAIYYPIYHRVQGDEFKVVRTDWCYADESTVSQYAGVKDKNGRKSTRATYCVLTIIRTMTTAWITTSVWCSMMTMRRCGR